jgi:nucleotide sugar dehydrogenase
MQAEGGTDGARAPASARVVVQGLGFVGAAMAVAVARATDAGGRPLFGVTGVDLDTEAGRRRVDSLNRGRFPFRTADREMTEAARAAVSRGNLRATTDPAAMADAGVILVSVNLDVGRDEDGRPRVDFGPFRSALHTLGRQVAEGTLVVIESTVPPGTCTGVVRPILEGHLRDRNLDPGSVHIAHSYERVMPGPDYLESIVSFPRVYSGTTEEAARRCGEFLSRVIDVERHPLTRLGSTVASETAKVLENSYRAVNIAFMEEWGRFAEETGIDLFEVIDAIRVRPTHSNMRQPGFGVGGYCLTKDPLLARIAARDLFGLSGHDFPFSSAAVETNRRMPLVTLEKLRRHLGGSLEGAGILLLGVSYREGVGDTRHTPAETFVRKAQEEGAEVTPADPFVDRWEELGIDVDGGLPDPSPYDAVVFAVPHGLYRRIDIDDWLGRGDLLVLDANNVLTAEQREAALRLGHPLVCIGRG